MTNLSPLVAACLLLVLPSLAGCDDKPAKDVAKPASVAAQPLHDIADYAARRAGCNHWGGEEGTDAARRAEINKAATALRCDSIDADEAALLKQYSDKPEALHQIRAAHDKLL